MRSSWLGSFQRAGPAVCGVIVAASMYGQQASSVSAQGFDGGAAYARNVSLDPNVDLFWAVDTEAETIRLALQAKAATGWAGVGISEMGGMEGADILFYEVAVSQVVQRTRGPGESGLTLLHLAIISSRHRRTSSMTQDAPRREQPS